MRLNWDKLPKQPSMSNLVASRKPKEILVEYDGPQIVILKDGPREFLAVATDYDDQAVRWLQAPLSELEYRALMQGALTVRDALSKSNLILADYSYSNEPLRVWEVNPSLIPDAALPQKNAFLPISLRNAQAPDDSLALPEFRFSTPQEPTDHSITFTRLSVVTSRLQALWNAIAPQFNAERAILSASAVTSGSVRIKVRVEDRILFSKIAQSYRDLARAAYDAELLDELLSKIPVNISFAYEDFLKALDLNELEILAQWQEGAAYVGYESAQRTRSAVRSVLEKSTPVFKETASLRGHLVGFTRKTPRFEFYDLDSGETLIGTIVKDLRKESPFSYDIVLGRSQLYNVHIEITRRGDEPPKYKLLSFQAANTPPRLPQ